MKLQNKVAIVTGASSGIGWAIALALAERGTRVALGARNLATLQELADKIQSRGGEALAVLTDVTRQEQVEQLAQETLSKWGQIDILISNAGQYIRCPITELTISLLEQSMAVNFYGGVYAVLAVLPHMLSRRSGHIVLVSTMNAKKGLPPDAPYVAAKFALSGFGEVLRQELYRTGVDVTTVYPGRVDTPMIQNLRVPWISTKISAETVTRAIVRSIERRKAEVILPPQTKLLHYLNFLSPRLGDWAVRYFHLEGWES
jgi:NAD(P)-dependent dehydrogenase (short-subunit alcohol dehydrogenase family)